MADRREATSLTPRQHTILQLLIAGYTDHVVAAHIDVSRRTISRETAAVGRRLGAESRFGIGVAAVCTGVISKPQTLAHSPDQKCPSPPTSLQLEILQPLAQGKSIPRVSDMTGSTVSAIHKLLSRFALAVGAQGQVALGATAAALDYVCAAPCGDAGPNTYYCDYHH